MQTNIIAKCNSSSRERPRCGQKETETTTEQLKEKQKKQNRNTGYPALDPTTNKYLSGSGWETWGKPVNAPRAPCERLGA